MNILASLDASTVAHGSSHNLPAAGPARRSAGGRWTWRDTNAAWKRGRRWHTTTTVRWNHDKCWTLQIDQMTLVPCRKNRTLLPFLTKTVSTQALSYYSGPLPNYAIH